MYFKRKHVRSRNFTVIMSSFYSSQLLLKVSNSVLPEQEIRELFFLVGILKFFFIRVVRFFTPLEKLHMHYLNSRSDSTPKILTLVISLNTMDAFLCW